MASTSSETPSLSLPSSSSSIRGSNYDVFLSFRGEDTRHSFTDHLHEAFRLRGIDAFRDSDKLQLGQEIAPELKQAIRNSRYAIVVFSEKYADSRWCLEELVEIVECKRNKGLEVVVPVFYHVDPSDVRKQTGPFEKAFDEHQKNDSNNREKIHKWKDAMREIGDLTGEHLLPHQRSEATVIQKIIRRISLELDQKFSIGFKHLVGMDSRVKDMLDLCTCEGLDCVHFVGICGMGGIGKTTLAQEIYGRIYSDFEAWCFLENVRENAKSNGLVSLQKILLSKIFKGTEIIIHDSYEGINVIGTRLHNKKVLIVLDDVDEEKQLEALAGNGGWFGPGSVIIVTSRDKHLLRRHGVKYIYEPKKLNQDEALMLFSWKAFKKLHPEENYVDLSIHFVRYADGLPLALEVLGSSLFDRKLDVWRSAREKLEKIPNRGIMDVLKISYDGLEPEKKELFLDIACFFKGEQEDCARDTLESLGHFAKCDIEVLKDKSLITIEPNRTLSMHDLLQEMGHGIVRSENLEEPGQRSRLWDYKDVLHVLKNNSGTELVKGIVLKMPESLSAEVFSKMKKLRFLKIGCQLPLRGFDRYHVQLPGGLSYLPSELRIIDWHRYPLTSMPTNFQPIKLVELRMHCSGIKTLWKGIVILNELKLIDLSDSQKLIEIQDLSGASNLEKLILQNCTRLYKIHASVGYLKKLIQLDVSGCKNLSSLPNTICNLTSLKILNLCDCSRLVKLSENLGNLEGLEELNVSGTAIGLSLSSLLLKNLKKLFFGGCAFLLPKEILNFPFFQRSPDPMGMLTSRTLSSLSSLTYLNLSYCDLQTVPDAIGCCLPSLNHLNLKGNKFDCLPTNIGRLSNLGSLLLSGCKDLRLLPELPLNIKYIGAEGCTSLETLPFRPEDVFSPHLFLINCVKLIENQSFGDLFSTMLARYMQIPDDLGYQNFVVPEREVPIWIQTRGGSIIDVPQRPNDLGNPNFVIPGSEIPKWFSHQTERLSMNLQGPSGITGIAMCVAFIIPPHPSIHELDSECIIWMYNVCYADGTRITEFLGDKLSEQFGKIDSCHLWIKYFPLERKRGKELSQIDDNRLSQIDVTLKVLKSGIPLLKMKKLGARLVYEQDIEDLKKNMPGPCSCSSTPYEDNLDDSAKDTETKRSRDDFEGDGAGPSGEGTSNEVDEPQPKRIHTTP